MKVSRREFLKASSAVLAALGFETSGLLRMKEALGLEAGEGGVPVVWLQAQNCSGCSVSVLNSIYYKTIDDLLLNVLDLEHHPTIMAGAGNPAIAAAEKAYRRGGYVLVWEGAIPTAAGGEYCYLWPGLTAQKGIERYAKRASVILGVGSCACFGGMVSGTPNPTGAQGLENEYYGKTVIKIPGCPPNPDWVVGTVAHLLERGEPPELDFDNRPLLFFEKCIHEDWCPRYQDNQNEIFAAALGEPGCMEHLGCKGPFSFSDCPSRKWNSGGQGQPGVNWCIGAGAPCIGCTEWGYPDRMSPFYHYEEE